LDGRLLHRTDLQRRLPPYGRIVSEVMLMEEFFERGYVVMSSSFIYVIFVGYGVHVFVVRMLFDRELLWPSIVINTTGHQHIIVISNETSPNFLRLCCIYCDRKSREVCSR
jgi:hypothetical protein